MLKRWGESLQSIFDHHLLMILLASGMLAYSLPESAGLSVLLASKAYLPWVFAAAMLAIGSVLPGDEARQTWETWPSVLYGTVAQYSIMPLLAFVLSTLISLDPSHRAGLILCGCVPGAMASNVITLMARGNVTYSVSVTTMSTLLSPGVVPVALSLLLSRSVPTNLSSTSWNLLWQVVLPVLLGFGLSRVSRTYSRLMQAWGPVVANLAILWIISFVVAENRHSLIYASPAIVIALAALNISGYVLGYGAGALAGFDAPRSRALSIEVGMQNAGLGTVLALQLFPDDPAVRVPTALYTFGCVFSGTILAWVWARTSTARF